MLSSIRSVLRPEKLLRDRIIDAFHRIYYNAPDTWRRNYYLGLQVAQYPADLWLYQELIHRERPAFILQTGVAAGGSVLYFAHMLDLIGADPGALVIGVDLELSESARSISHPRVRLIEGSSVAPETVAKVKDLLPAPTGLVSLDSDHSRDHVLKELQLYSSFSTVGGHLVVEDTNINGHPVYTAFGPGPFEAVKSFLEEDTRFVRDDALWKRNLFSLHQYGWLRRVR